ncbi:DUF6088 family protein [Flavobacterium pectinovorum]|uniref:Transcriptional regulator, AbiEi antitoxin, Type IV TA system n=1 Tax=Flavobacterium pectinovorum TaxID=29533 RepID=A0A502E048_9FLAO|nr:DUF6088 family protein [Flavobacterium pectinovorum]TPG29790.1 hypothetical protein EAH81_27405 [Flavobacterium pectinovorum]
MTTTDKINRRIKQIAPGEVFGYASLGLSADEVMAGAKALSRLTSKGIVKRARKGYYYKPKVSVFGEQKPREEALLGLYLYEDSRQTAYITGTRLYNRLGLTTQVPNSVRVASHDRQIKGRAGSVLVKPAKSYVKVTPDKIRYLEILDVMKDFNSIPDMQAKDGLAYLKKEIGRLKNDEIKKLVSYGILYPPKVRALLGAVLEDTKKEGHLKKLKASINPSSRYQFSITVKLLPTINLWNIE